MRAAGRGWEEDDDEAEDLEMLRDLGGDATDSEGDSTKEEWSTAVRRAGEVESLGRWKGLCALSASGDRARKPVRPASSSEDDSDSSAICAE